MAVLHSDAVLDAIIATLRRINGAGSYENDLTVTGSQPDRIYKGFFFKPPVPPSAPTDSLAGRPAIGIYINSMATEPGPSMQRFTTTAVYLLQAWCAPSPRHPGSRIENAANLMQDIDKALRSNQSLIHLSSTFSTGSLVDDVSWQAVPFDDDGNIGQQRGQQYGRLDVAITTSWRSGRPTQTAAP
jgi:hypothetical protein